MLSNSVFNVLFKSLPILYFMDFTFAIFDHTLTVLLASDHDILVLSPMTFTQ